MFKLITLTSRLSVCCPDRVVVAFPVGKIIHLFLDCLKHNRSLCHECKEDGLCDGQAADECDFISLAEFETILTDRSAKLDDQFSTINEVLKAKKEVFMEMYRKDPRAPHDEAVSRFREYIEAYNPTNPEELPELETVETVATLPIMETKQTIVCDSFSIYKENVTVSNCNRFAKAINGMGYCFLNHPKIEENQILKWSLRVPKFNYFIGMVIHYLIIRNVPFCDTK